MAAFDGTGSPHRRWGFSPPWRTDMKKTLALAIILASWLTGTGLASASGQGIRCGADLVTPGYLKFEVSKTCGEPLSKEIVGEVEFFDSDDFYDRRYSRFPERDRRLLLYVEEWIYDSGGLVVLRFEGNRLVKVESVRRK
jgi:hypothetical protein